MAPRIAILGAGIFVKTQYIPRLAEISDLVSLKFIWSRSEESAKSAAEVARKHFADVECVWGDNGLEQIIKEDSILGVAVVLAGQAQSDMNRISVLNSSGGFNLTMISAMCALDTLLMNIAPVVAPKLYLDYISEIENALSRYNSICPDPPGQPIWAVAENYRFEPAFVECKKLIAEIGDMMSVQVIVEGSMNSSNPYFSSSWRRNFTITGCEVVSVSAITSHIDKTLPPPDNISSNFQLENGCSGVFVMVVSSRSPKACGKVIIYFELYARPFIILYSYPLLLQIFWRVVGMKGTLQVERGNQDGRHGYLVTQYGADGQSKSMFYPFSGVTEELKAFIHDISEAKKGINHVPEPRSSFLEGARDVALLEAMLESGSKQGALVHVKKF
ncbi:GFO IDH MocA domain-containing protein [Citrus sinensis]|uniref:GFO IDH MocA domain-containing protein n=1 Tax=Citrus sinensis TaxID=2711 RepID=A0ACB8MWL1_CITSI|nr:GFO IDH MocA domain-containing protein [Citrus sinensis]KAH9789520.1 GFO IDH MocA domain-containing protein [Citrus sinensis]